MLCTGVYLILNLVNRKVYVGSAARSLRSRIADHRRMLRKGVHPNHHLQRAWAKYGESKFRFTVLERCPPDKCLEREQYWLDNYRSYEQRNGYNQCPKAGSVLGYRWKRDPSSYDWMKDPVWVEKIRKSTTGRKHTEETKAKISAGNKGKLTGRKLTGERRAKFACVWVGKNHTEETKAKIPAALTGHEVSLETRKKMSEAAKRRWHK